MGGAGGGSMAGSFRDLMKLLVQVRALQEEEQVHLPEPVTLFRFLCVLWVYSSNHGDQLDVKVSAILQIQALYMGGALLSVQSAATLQELSAAESPALRVREVRKAALAALQSLSGASSSPFQPITEKLLRTKKSLLPMLRT
ncbi:hypothetical protein INR49_020204 [Caranx melampygus]|nr:hypothetical protein INR49_020204 [Caranx melampygus]